jgi:hypothetical protein
LVKQISLASKYKNTKCIYVKNKAKGKKLHHVSTKRIICCKIMQNTGILVHQTSTFNKWLLSICSICSLLDDDVKILSVATAFVSSCLHHQGTNIFHWMCSWLYENTFTLLIVSLKCIVCMTSLQYRVSCVLILCILCDSFVEFSLHLLLKCYSSCEYAILPHVLFRKLEGEKLMNSIFLTFFLRLQICWIVLAGL